MNTVTISTKAELARHQASIEKLFVNCFGSRMSLELWHWAYLANPNGEPLVSLCYDDEALVGHYAIIPLPLASADGRLNTYLSMTTMVAASHRQHGLFVKLAENTYANAAKAGIDFVMGFPNEMSAPGFKKRLHWDLPPSDYVASMSKAQVLVAARELPLFDPAQCRLDLQDRALRDWRLSRPGASYTWDDGLVYKEFGDTIDLLAFDRIEQLDSLPDERTVNLLVPARLDSLLRFKSFDYQFGGRSIGSTFAPEKIVRQMALSDVF